MTDLFILFGDNLTTCAQQYLPHCHYSFVFVLLQKAETIFLNGSSFFYDCALRIKAITVLEQRVEFTALKLRIQIIPQWHWHTHIWIFISHPGLLPSSRTGLFLPNKTFYLALHFCHPHKHTQYFFAWRLSKCSVHYFGHLSSASVAKSS